MPDIAIARVLHVLAIIFWTGGVGMVTTVLLPAIRRSHAAEQRFPVFHATESWFAWQAWFSTLIAGASGFYMAWRIDAWNRFRSSESWWTHAMVLTWLVFMAMLFAIEPLFLEKFLQHRAALASEATYRLVEWLYRALLALNFLTVAGAVAGSMGVNQFAW